MSRICISFLVLGLLATSAAGQEDKPKKAKGKFTIGKETTYLTGPLTKDGYIDYATALNERLRRGVTPANNAKVLVMQAIGPYPEKRLLPAEFYKLLGMAELPKKGKYFLGSFQHMKNHLEVDPVRDVADLQRDFDAAMSGPWKSAQYPVVTGWIMMNEEPFAAVREATKRTHYYSPLLPFKGEGLMGCRISTVAMCHGLGEYLAIRAYWHLGEGRKDAAWQDLLTLHRLSRHVGRGGTFIEGLVGIALDAIASHADLVYLDRAKLDAKRIQQRLRDLQALPPMMPGVADRIDLTERFCFLDTVMMVDRHGIKYLDTFGDSLPAISKEVAERILDGIDWDPALRNSNRWYDRLAAMHRVKVRAARQKQMEQIEQDLDKLKKAVEKSPDLAKLLAGKKLPAQARGKLAGDLLISVLIPPLRKFPHLRKLQHAFDRSEQTQRNLFIAFALAAYQRDHGRYPAKLDALAPKYLAHIPQDLFSGTALIYRPIQKGYLLYSVGPNGLDDGGRQLGEGGDDIRITR